MFFVFFSSFWSIDLFGSATLWHESLFLCHMSRLRWRLIVCLNRHRNELLWKQGVYVLEHTINTKRCGNVPREGIYMFGLMNWDRSSFRCQLRILLEMDGRRKKRWKEGPNSLVVERVWWEGRTEVTSCIGLVVRALATRQLSCLPAASQQCNTTGLKDPEMLQPKQKETEAWDLQKTHGDTGHTDNLKLTDKDHRPE